MYDGTISGIVTNTDGNPAVEQRGDSVNGHAATVHPDLGNYLHRVGLASLILVGSLVVASVFLGAGWVLTFLVGLTVATESVGYQLFRFFALFTMIVVATVVTSCSAIVTCSEAVVSTSDFIRSLRTRTGR